MSSVVLPYWMEVVRAIGPAFGSLLAVLAAIAAAVIAYRAYRQRERADGLSYRQRKVADERAEWWRRTQWTIDYASDPDEEKVRIGLRTLRFLLSSDLASEEDKAMVRALLTVVITAREGRDYNGSTASDATKLRSRWTPSWGRRGK